MFHLRRGLTAIAFVAMTVSAATVAHADIIILSGNIPQVDENVLLNTGLSGNPIFGTTNQTGLSVRLMSDELLAAPANGQARIEAVDGMLDQLTIDIPGPTFTSLILNINAAAAGSTSFTVTEDNGQQTMGTFALGAGGQNFFTITAINGQRMSNVFFTTDVAMVLTNVSDVAQIRIGGAARTPGAPEPAAMLLFGTALLGGAVRRWRQQ